MTSGSERLEGMAFVCAAVVFEAFAQIALKRAADRVARRVAAGTTHSVLSNYFYQKHWFAAGIACFIIEGLLWTMALRKLPVSVAQPAGSLVIVIVAMLSSVVLRERLSPLRWLGVLLILGGVIMVGAF